MTVIELLSKNWLDMLDLSADILFSEMSPHPTANKIHIINSLIIAKCNQQR